MYPRAVGASLVVGAVLMVPRSASAAPTESSAAQALFDEAVEKMKEHDYASACPKLEEVVRLLPDAIGAKVELASCYEGAGRLASAWSRWSEVQVVAHRAGQAEREAKAIERVRALKPKLSYVTIEVPSGVAGLSSLVVRRGGVMVGRAQWGTRIPVDGGDLEISATATRYLPFRKTVSVAASNDAIVVTLPETLRQDVTGADTPQRRPIDDPATSTRAWQRPVGVGATAVGAAGVLVGAVLGGLAMSKHDSSNDGENKCVSGTNRCGTQAGADLRAEALHLATGSTIAFIAGGVLAAGGIVLWTTAPKSEEKAGEGARIRVTPRSMMLEGTF